MLLYFVIRVLFFILRIEVSCGKRVEFSHTINCKGVHQFRRIILRVGKTRYIHRYRFHIVKYKSFRGLICDPIIERI